MSWPFLANRSHGYLLLFCQQLLARDKGHLLVYADSLALQVVSLWIAMEVARQGLLWPIQRWMNIYRLRLLHQLD